jgi:predicted secreted Zn-dependent protease
VSWRRDAALRAASRTLAAARKRRRIRYVAPDLLALYRAALRRQETPR